MSTDEIPACVSCITKSDGGKNLKIVSADKCKSLNHVAVVSLGVGSG